MREAYGIARQESLKLRDFPTLAHVVQFVYDFRPDLAPEGAKAPGGPAVVAPVASSPAPSLDGNAPTQAEPVAAPRFQVRLEDADKMPRRLPVPSLRPALDRCKPTGVALGKGARVVVAADEGGVATALAGVLEKRGAVVLSLAAATATEEVTSRVTAWLKQGPVHGVFWLPALDVEPERPA